MSELFATIYDTVFGIFDNRFFPIFQHLFENGGYVKFGLSFILIPLICWFLFYYFWKYPYAKIWHWLVWLAFTVLIVFSATYGVANMEILNSYNQTLNDLIADASSGYSEYATSLPPKYALANSLLAIIIGLIYSLIMKQFSKIQIHLPF